MAERSHWKGRRGKSWIPLLFLGFGVGTAVIVNQQMGEVAIRIVAGVMAGLIFGVIMTLTDFRLGMRSGVDKMRLLQNFAPRAETTQPNMFVLDHPKFGQPTPQSRGELGRQCRLRHVSC